MELKFIICLHFFIHLFYNNTLSSFYNHRHYKTAFEVTSSFTLFIFIIIYNTISTKLSELLKKSKIKKKEMKIPRKIETNEHFQRNKFIFFSFYNCRFTFCLFVWNDDKWDIMIYMYI